MDFSLDKGWFGVAIVRAVAALRRGIRIIANRQAVSLPNGKKVISLVIFCSVCRCVWHGRTLGSYAYSFAGRSFNSTRIGLNDGSSTDNIDDWHQTWYQTLTDAKNNERTVLAWVNPDQPEHALLDRNVRWPMVFFQLPFALLFTAVGAIAATVFVFLLINRPIPFGSLLRDINRKANRSSKKQSFVSADLAMLWLLTFCWCSLSFPFAGLVWITNANWLAKAVLTLFTGIGLVLMYGAVELSIERIKRTES